MISAVEFEKRMVSASILSIIIGKFCYRKKLCPVILFEIDEGSKINFYYIILLFDFTVRL